MRTVDGGATWTVPEEHGSFTRAPFTWRNEKDLEITVCDFWPRWHARSGKLIGIGHTVVYEDNQVKPVRPLEELSMRFTIRINTTGRIGEPLNCLMSSDLKTRGSVKWVPCHCPSTSSSKIREKVPRPYEVSSSCPCNSLSQDGYQ